MINSNTRKAIFLEKCESKSPVKLSNISTPKQGNLIFFNTNLGSRMEDLSNINFKFQELSSTKISDILKTQAGGKFDVIGKISWLEERQNLCGPQKKLRTVRTAVLADESASIKLSVWGELIKEIGETETYKLTSLKTEDYFGLRLATVADTAIMKADEDIVVNWEEHNIQPLKTTLCCPQVESARVHSFLQCVNHDCKKKVTPYPGETKVTCNAATCRRKMLVKRFDF